MKLECPYCWQHYEINAADRDQDFVCLCCEQTFNGKDALLLPDTRGGERKWCRILLIAVLLLVGLNLVLWQRCAARERQEAVAAASVEPLGQPSLERELAELRARQTRLEEQLRTLREELGNPQTPIGDRSPAE